MSPLFKLGEQRLMPPPWLVKINAVMKGTLDAQEELDCAQGEDDRRLAQQKLTRFIFTAERLIEERQRAETIARILAG